MFKIFYLCILIILFFSGCNKDHYNFENTLYSHLKKDEVQKELKRLSDINHFKIENREQLLIRRGFLYFHLGKLDSAEYDFTYVLEKDSLNSDALAGIAAVYIRKNNLTSALNMINRAVQIDSLNPTIYYVKSLYYIKNKNYSKALINIDHILNKYETFYELNVQKSIIFADLDSIKGINRELTIAFEKSDFDPGILIARASFNEEYKNYDQALKDYSLLIKKYRKEQNTAYLLRANLYNKLGQYDKAIHDYKFLSVSDSNAVYCNYSIAKIFAKIQNYDSTLYYSKKAINKNGYTVKQFEENEVFSDFLNNEKYYNLLKSETEKK